MRACFGSAGKKIVLMISEPKAAAHLRAVNLFVTAGRPARAPGKEGAVVPPADDDRTRGAGLLLEVAL